MLAHLLSHEKSETTSSSSSPEDYSAILFIFLLPSSSEISFTVLVVNVVVQGVPTSFDEKLKYARN